MNRQHTGIAAQKAWHSSLNTMLALAVVVGLGRAGHILFGQTWLPYDGAVFGAAFGAGFCVWVYSRLKKGLAAMHLRALDRAGTMITFPRFFLGLVRYGLIAGAATGLGALIWTGIETFALERPFSGTLEILLGLLVSASTGAMAFHLLLRLLDSD